MTCRPLMGLLSLVIAAPASLALDISGPEFSEKSCGAKTEDGWNLFSNGQLASWVTFHETGVYEFAVRARGQAARGVWPRMRILAGMQVLGNVNVEGTEAKTYTVRGDLPEGPQRIAVAFVNDYFRDGEDRNLYILSVSIRARHPDSKDPTLAATPDWQGRAREGIARHRTGRLVLRVTNVKGEGLPGAVVRARLVRHDFLFGCCLSSAFLSGRMDAEDQQRYADRFDELFNHAVTENALKWAQTNRNGPDPDFAQADRLLSWCEKKGIPLRGHCLLWASDRRVPAWARELSDKDLTRAVYERFEQILNRYRGRIAEHDLNNEMVHCNYFARRLGRESRVDMFRQAHRVDPSVRLYVNDFNILSGRDAMAYADQIAGFIEKGAPVGGIGCQGHFGKNGFDPNVVTMVLDRLARFKLPIKITEFDIDTADEGKQALWLTDFYRLCFGHPAVEGILMWGFWERAHWKPRAALYRADWTEKPSAAAYKHLLFREWTTDASGRTGKGGTFSCQAFFGTYRIEVTPVVGKPFSAKVTFKKTDAGKTMEVAQP